MSNQRDAENVEEAGVWSAELIWRRFLAGVALGAGAVMTA